MTAAAEWYVIGSGEHTGRAHMSGWQHTAIRTGDHHVIESRWWSLALCPRCFAVVQADKKDVFGDMTWAHEQWHARTDHPIPPDVLAEVTRP